MTSKEKLEAIKKCILNWDEKEIKWFDDISKNLERLEQIDNANPSKALKCLKNNSELFDEIAKENPTTYKNETFAEAFLFKTNTIEIEQALLKAQEQDKILERLKRPMFYSQRKKLGEEFLSWAKENNADQCDLTNIITWCFCFKMKEWLNNEKEN